MSEPELRFPEYGMGGDLTGARRARRAFRFAILLLVAFTGALYFAENYLRYDRLETQYILSLTHHPDSARAFLRQVVKHDAEDHEVPSAKYVEALASIEEPDLVLKTYEKAYALDATNSSLILNYGVRLFLTSRFDEARERFREAGVQPPRNALARYLEAAAIVAAAKPTDDLSEAIALIARTNNTDDPLLFPEPPWHASLPKHGAWYAGKQRELVDLTLAPLYQMSDTLLRRASLAIDSGSFQEWDSWLEKLEGMGARLLGPPLDFESTPSAAQAMAGLQFQSDALPLRIRIARHSGNNEAEVALTTRSGKLVQAMEMLRTAERQRQEEIEQTSMWLYRPLSLVWRAFALLTAVSFAFSLFLRFRVRAEGVWSLRHSSAGVGAFALAFVWFVVLLFVMYLLRHEGLLTLGTVTIVWWLGLALLLLFGLFYPRVALPAPERVIEARGDSVPESLPLLARAARNEAAWNLLRRYYSVLLGIFVAAVCTWILLFRIGTGAYPTQLDLLVPGMLDEERATVVQVQQLLVQQG